MFYRRNMASKELLIILAIIQFYIGTSGAPSSAVENPKICDTIECHQLAGAFLKAMNKSADPCVDFYEFACGNWTAEDEISEFTTSWSRYKEFEFLTDHRLRSNELHCVDKTILTNLMSGEDFMMIIYDLTGIFNLTGELESPPTLKDILPVKQAKRFYQSCMDIYTRAVNGFDRLNSILRSTNGWPMIMSWWYGGMSWQEIDRYYSNWLARAFYKANLDCTRAEGVITPSFQITVVPPPSSLYQINFDNHTERNLYRLMIKSQTQILIEDHGTNVWDEELERDIDNLITFEEKLRKAIEHSFYHGETQLYSSSNDTGIFKLNGFIGWWNSRTESIATTPKANIDWYDELQREFAFQNISINGNTTIIFQQFGYFIELIKLLESTDARTIVNYIQWRFVFSSAGYFTEDMMDTIYDLRKKMSGAQGEVPRWNQCIHKMEMKDANMYIYGRKYYPNSTHGALLTMISHLKESLELQIKNSNFSNTTVEAMKRRLGQIKFLLGYPDWLKNKTALIKFYEGLTIGRDYFQNFLNYKKYEKKAALRRCVGSMATETWYSDSPALNAYYIPITNSIKVLAPLVQSPLFGTDVPNYINYGIVGFTIGHEMGHAYGIDELSATFGNNERILEDADDRKTYVERTASFMYSFDEYYKANNITLKLSGVPTSALNSTGAQLPTLGQLSYRENIADWIGMQVALHAYKEMRKKELPNGELKLPGFQEYNDQQMFFISYAQQRCEKPKTTSVSAAPNNYGTQYAPPHLRLMVPLSNTAAFANTFECPKGTPMNPENKTNLWTGPTSQIHLSKMSP